jgi:error-prone DNA polymerase
VPVGALERLAEADAFGSLCLSRRQALWAIRAFRNEALPLFAAADERALSHAPEFVEPDVDLVPMLAGREVVEDYRSVGLSLRRHPVAFLRAELDQRRIISCAELRTARDGRRITVAGIVLVRQRPGSAKGVLFVTIEDETGNGNLIIWPSQFEKQRRVILSSRMLGCRGRLQKEGDVIHVIAEHLTDLSDLLVSVGGRDDAFPIGYGRSGQPTSSEGSGARDRLRSVSAEERASPEILIRPRDFR